jgi:hypothetical protein
MSLATRRTKNSAIGGPTTEVSGPVGDGGTMMLSLLLLLSSCFCCSSSSLHLSNQPTNEPLVHYHDPHRAPAATYGDWFDGDDAELEKMVDEFQNEPQQQHRNNVGDRVRESVAELCGALDELIEEEDAISNGRGIRDSVPSLREQLINSWQGKSYYERLQNVVDADAVCYIHPSDLMPPDAT